MRADPQRSEYELLWACKRHAKERVGEDERGREEAAQAEEAEETIIMPAPLYKTMIQLHDALSCESIVRGTTQGASTRKYNEPRQGRHANYTRPVN